MACTAPADRLAPSPPVTAPTTPQPPARDQSDMVKPAKKQFVQLHNLIHDTTTVDSLHCKGLLVDIPHNSIKINAGSLMNTEQPHPKSPEQVLTEAEDFIGQYFDSIRKHNSPAHQKRMSEVRQQIHETGTYELAQHELVFGAKLAWRNTQRCIGRIQWSKLQVFDCRHVGSPRDMYEAMVSHIKYGNNNGNIRSAITIFPQRRPGCGDFRVWNAQIVRYCGYTMDDGSVLGDRANIEFTDMCIKKLGWKPPSPKTPFDVLPLVLQANGKMPEVFNIPLDIVVEVKLRHPEYDWLAEMGLKWYALPGVSNLMLDCGGVEFCAAPFNGWYMGTEIARDFCDEQRFGLLPEFARRMKLDVSNPSTLWKDRAFVEFNRAVLYSFQQDNVTITDHHSASQSFMKHMENENRARGGCPADWVWIVPPMSGSLTEVFHQEMLYYHMKPNYEYQDNAWANFNFGAGEKGVDTNAGAPVQHKKRKFTFRDIARAVKFSAKLMSRALANRVKCTILYATETGRSERYARQLCDIFRYGFDANVMCMADYDASSVVNEQILLIVASTFGNGDAPENGAEFYQFLRTAAENNGPAENGLGVKCSFSENDAESKQPERAAGQLAEPSLLSNVRFSVFALGSTAYPKFCSYGKFLDCVCEQLGGERLLPIACGDEMAGQDQTFKDWARTVFERACDVFCLTNDIDMKSAGLSVTQGETSWAAGRFRLVQHTSPPLTASKSASDILCESYSSLHRRAVMPCTFRCKTTLQNKELAERQTILVELDTHGDLTLNNYEPGDHVGICPANEQELVDIILKHTTLSGSKSLLDAPMVLEQLVEKKQIGLYGEANSKHWQLVERLPACSIREALTNYLDITTPPKQFMLELLSTQCVDEKQREHMEELAKDTKQYESWKFQHWPNLADLCRQFPSLKLDPTLLLYQLPLLQPRFYSISSSIRAHPNQIHVTVAVVKYRTDNGRGPEHHGVCSAFLERLQPGDIVPCFVRHAPTFHLPTDRVPVVMIGAGTGIAPFRSFWHHRRWQQSENDADEAARVVDASTWSLYFGCRRSKEDDIYKHETDMHRERFKVLTEVHTALSREPNVPKTYVQHMMLKNAPAIYKTVMENGHVYICGDVNMAAGVFDALVEIICQHSADMKQNDEAQKYITQLRAQNRLHEDIFGTYVPTPDGGKRRG